MATVLGTVLEEGQLLGELEVVLVTWLGTLLVWTQKAT